MTLKPISMPIRMEVGIDVFLEGRGPSGNMNAITISVGTLTRSVRAQA